MLLAEDDWNAINETLHPLLIPGVRESLREGMDAKLDKCSHEWDW